MKTLYFGGPILTMSDPLYVQAVLVEGGNILAAGSLDRLEAMDADRRVDLKGSTLLPGFIDPHSHFSQMASACLQVSLEGAVPWRRSHSGSAVSFRRPPPPPAPGWPPGDYDNNRMPGLAAPTLEQLDAMAPGHPLVIHHKSGHMGLMNSAALSALGITPETPVPPGGKIGVKDRCLTGYLEENAFFTYLKQLPPTPPDQLLSAYARAQEQYAAHGITTIQDGMAVEEMFPMYQMLLDSGILKLDLVVYPSPQAYDAAVERFGALPPERHLRIGGMKVYLDGSPQGRTAWMREPYAGRRTTGDTARWRTQPWRRPWSWPACGAPSCQGLAEDIVQGKAHEIDCIFKLRASVHKLSQGMLELAKQIPIYHEPAEINKTEADNDEG